jgi:hypothetical protein
VPQDRRGRAARLLSEALAASLAEGMHLAAEIARNMAEAIETGRLPEGPGSETLRAYADMIERNAAKAEAMAQKRHDDG